MKCQVCSKKSVQNCSSIPEQKRIRPHPPILTPPKPQDPQEEPTRYNCTSTTIIKGECNSDSDNGESQECPAGQICAVRTLNGKELKNC